MSFLKKELELYKETFGNYKLKVEDLRPTKEEKELEEGDIFVLSGDFPEYGIVVRKIEDMYEAIYLSQEVFLSSSEALRLKVDHFSDYVYLTHINFYLTNEFAKKYCKVIKKVRKEDMRKILENYEKLNAEEYTGPRKEYFELVVERIEILYDIFFGKILRG